MNRDLKRTWVRIEKWFDAYAPYLSKDFGQPATLREIAKTEKHLGAVLPEDLRQSFLRHNGHRSLMGGDAWLSLEEIRCSWDTGHSQGTGLIPLTSDELGDFCVDLRHGEHYGNIVATYRRKCEGTVADSFSSWLESFAAGLESFEYYPDGCELEAIECYHAELRRGKQRLRQEWWQFVLELAVLFGWKPAGTEKNQGGIGDSLDELGYFNRGDGEIVTKPDALALGQAIERLAAAVPIRVSMKFKPHAFVIQYLNLHGSASLIKLAKFCMRGSFEIDL